MYTNASWFIVPGQTEPNAIRVDINGVTSFVPLDPANSDYAAIMLLVSKGELTIAPASEASE